MYAVKQNVLFKNSTVFADMIYETDGSLEILLILPSTDGSASGQPNTIHIRDGY